VRAGPRPGCCEQTINAEAGFLRGHGTYVRDGVLLASVAGVVQVGPRAGAETRCARSRGRYCVCTC